jgi:hypothetical protein
MKILFVSHSIDGSQTAITVMHEPIGDPAYSPFYTEKGSFEIYLYNDNGHQELWSVANTFVDAVMLHKSLCEKCSIRVNM